MLFIYNDRFFMTNCSKNCTSKYNVSKFLELFTEKRYRRLSVKSQLKLNRLLTPNDMNAINPLITIDKDLISISCPLGTTQQMFF